MMERKLKLCELIGYANADGFFDDTIQVGIGADGWDDYTEIRAASTLLEIYHDWTVTVLGACLSDDEDSPPVLRCVIEKPD